MLGQSLINEFSDYNVVGFDKESLNITDNQKVEEIFDKEQPDIIINAAAYTDVDEAEANEELVMKVNGEAVGLLASAANSIGAFFIHISTDYVFDGENEDGYNENTLPIPPESIYAKSKLEGERLLQEQGKAGLDYYLVRTSWLFGSGGKNFVDTMLNLAENNNELKIVNDQHGKPTYVKDLVGEIKNLIEEKWKSGIYHITNEPAMTWYDFAKIIFEIKKDCDSTYIVPKLTPVSSEEFPRPAKRPHWSVLNNTKLEKGRNIKEALKEYLC